MSTLTLVRHGQAHPASGGLTETGRRQACALAAYWMRREVTFDEVYSGPLLRHRETEAAVAASYKNAGRSWPTAHVLPEFDEYDADGVLRALAPTADFSDPRAFQRAFEEAMTQWFAHAGADPPFESWPRFRDRVRAGLAKIVAGGGNRRVVVFTSGGPIGLLVQIAVSAPERNFLVMNWRVRNTSLTEFLFSGARFTLDAFNTLPHLDPELATFR